MVRLKFLLFEEKTLAGVCRACKKNFLFYWCNRCSTGSSFSRADKRLTQVSFSFLWIIFSVIFKSIQSSTCWQNEAFASDFKFRTNPPRLGFEQPGLGTVKKQKVVKVLDVIFNFIFIGNSSCRPLLTFKPLLALNFTRLKGIIKAFSGMCVCSSRQ